MLKQTSTSFYLSKDIPMTKPLKLWLQLLGVVCGILLAPSASAQVTFDKELHDFGKVQQGEKLAYRFEFINTGKESLQIQKVEASCGCTAADFSKEAIAPNAKGYVRLFFDTADRQGTFYKSVLVRFKQANLVKALFVQGWILPPNSK